jgi:hypothetical protein
MINFPPALPCLFPRAPKLSPIEIEPEDLETLRKIQAAIETQQVILDNLHYAMEKQIQEKYHVDFTHENWTIDLDKGVLLGDGQGDGSATEITG